MIEVILKWAVVIFGCAVLAFLFGFILYLLTRKSPEPFDDDLGPM